MSGAGAEAFALVLLAATLGFAVVRPRGLPEAVAAVPAAALLLAVGALPLSAAGHVASRLGPTLGFLAAVLAIGHLCEREGLFAAAGRLLAGGARGRPLRLLALVFAVAAAVTVALSLDATVVLLTPVVLASAAAARLRPKPHVYACVHLANSASLLLPVSNLSNLLAFHQAGIGFLHFGALMALPWAAAIGVEWVVFRRAFAGELALPAEPESRSGDAAIPGPEGAPRFAMGVVLATLAGFAVASPLGIEPALVAAAGAVVLAVPALLVRRVSVGGLVRAASPGFLLFVLGLGMIVATAQRHGLMDQVSHVVPSGAGLPALLGIAALAALLANLVNNLPAILILIPVLAASGGGAGPLLAALIGVNVGPNLTYTGSLATLLWRRHLRGADAEPEIGEFLRLGVATVPLALVVATAALWVALQA